MAAFALAALCSVAYADHLIEPLGGDSISNQNFWLFLVSVAATVGIEVAIADMALARLGVADRKDALLAVGASNVFTAAFGWYILPSIFYGPGGFAFSLFLSVIVEGSVLYRALKRRIDFNYVLMIAIVMNVASAIATTAILGALSGFFA